MSTQRALEILAQWDPAIPAPQAARLIASGLHDPIDCRGPERGSARSGFPSWLFSLQEEPLNGQISGDEKANRTDPDRYVPLSYRYVPTIDEPQRVEKGDQCEDRASHENKDALFHRPGLLCFQPYVRQPAWWR